MTLQLETFVSYTMGIVVFLVGMKINRQLLFLRRFNIPEPVSGGMLAALITLLIYVAFDIEVIFDLTSRDVLLVYFFTSLGLNARIADLLSGGKPLLILAFLTLVYVVIQNLIGIIGISLFDLPRQLGLLVGSASLIGGHGTAIAWAPTFAASGVESALEIGVASATLGLVFASFVGGPIAKFLIHRHNLKPDSAERVVGLDFQVESTGAIRHTNLMTAILLIHISITVGWFCREIAEANGYKLPLYVTCMLAATVLSNTVPVLFGRVPWPTRTPALALISEFSLGLFLAMSLMSMQLWAVADLAGPLIVILGLQTLTAIGFILTVLFRMMGGDYQAAVLSAGFGGFVPGATPTAVANMTAVTKEYGPAPIAFIVLPLVAAFFVDLTNVVILQAGLNLLGLDSF